MSVWGGFEIPFYNPWCQGDQIIRVNDRDLTHSTQVSGLNKLGCTMFFLPQILDFFGGNLKY